MKKIYYCPMCDITCPYCIGLDYECVIGNPLTECDDYYACVGDSEDKEDDN